MLFCYHHKRKKDISDEKQKSSTKNRWKNNRKNGGVNGDDDVEKREGTLADIKAEASVDITGSWEETSFRAEKIVVYYFV